MSKELTYAERISKDEKTKDKESVQQANEEAFIQMKKDVWTAKVAVSGAKKSLSQARSRKPLDSTALLNSKIALAEAEENLELLQEENAILFDGMTLD